MQEKSLSSSFSSSACDGNSVREGPTHGFAILQYSECATVGVHSVTIWKSDAAIHI